MKKRLLLKKQEKDYFTSAQIILTSPFFFLLFSACARFFHIIWQYSKPQQQELYILREIGERERETEWPRRDEWKSIPPLFLYAFPTRGGEDMYACVCVFVNEAPASMKAARRRMKEKI